MTRELRGMKVGERRVLAADVRGRRVEIEAERLANALSFRAYDYAPASSIRVGSLAVRVTLSLFDTLEVRTMEEDRGKWRVLLPRWFKDVPVDFAVREMGKVSVLEVVGRGDTYELRGTFLLYEKGGKLGCVKGSICQKCLKPMVGAEALKELPDGVEVGVVHDGFTCLACELER